MYLQKKNASRWQKGGKRGLSPFLFALTHNALLLLASSDLDKNKSRSQQYGEACS